VVAEHTLTYTANGHRATDAARTRDADTGVLNARTYSYSYDPRDRIAEVVKTDTSSGATLSTESYRHDPASNVISQTIDGTTTSFVYDRNRLLTSTTSGVTASYNYDPFGRLNTVTAAGEVVESYSYDGFDRIAERTSIDQTGTSESTSYTYDPLDRTASRTDTTGKTTDYSYLGLSGEVLSEEIAGEIQKSYQYSPWGKRLSQVTHRCRRHPGGRVLRVQPAHRRRNVDRPGRRPSDDLRLHRLRQERRDRVHRHRRPRRRHPRRRAVQPVPVQRQTLGPGHRHLRRWASATTTPG
jgi:YD repeat-containing protein